SLDLSLLAPVGINTLQVDATATARALRYEPTEFAGPLHIYPVTGNPGSLYQTINLVYPLVDGVGNDLYVEEEMDDQQGYFLEACNNTECYD
ncbi:hypothetical protein ACE4Z5_25595, partial [Salmonella enterica]|uniref:hypothetical protein n=1 Tax=Salmonella enterica TaxID=28901 RepID=UPI003D2D26CC